MIKTSLASVSLGSVDELFQGADQMVKLLTTAQFSPCFGADVVGNSGVYRNVPSMSFRVCSSLILSSFWVLIELVDHFATRTLCALFLLLFPFYLGRGCC